jgi:hypothetical protein
MMRGTDFHFYQAYPFLGKEEECKVKRDILLKLSRRLKSKPQIYVAIQNTEARQPETASN